MSPDRWEESNGRGSSSNILSTTATDGQLDAHYSKMCLFWSWICTIGYILLLRFNVNVIYLRIISRFCQQSASRRYAAASCVWTSRALTRNFLTYLLTYANACVNVFQCLYVCDGWSGIMYQDICCRHRWWWWWWWLSTCIAHYAERLYYIRRYDCDGGIKPGIIVYRTTVVKCK